MPSLPPSRSSNLADSCRQSFWELWFMLGAWAFFCVWVLVAAAMSAYGTDDPDAALVLGLPAWVAWGLLLPWVSALVVTLWFAGWGMQDTPLEDEDGEGQAGHEDQAGLTKAEED